MYAIPALTVTLTAILLLAGSSHVLKATRCTKLTDQVNNSLHALMNLFMAAMLWNIAPSTMLAQVAVLAGAAFWFGLQAVARPEFTALCAASHGRVKCLYHSMSMGAAALMVAMMAHVTTTSPGAIPQTALSEMPGMPMTHDHHTMATTAQGTVTSTITYPPHLALLPAVFFTAAAAVFIILLLRSRSAKANRHNKTGSSLHARADHGLELLGAGAMAFMFATMGT